MTELIATNPSDMEHLIRTCVQSENTRRAYLTALREFEGFAAGVGIDTIDRASMIAWRTHMVEYGLAPKTISVRMGAIKTVIREMQARELIDDREAAQILSVKGVKMSGARTGKWLSEAGVRRLLESPPADTLIGKRDRAILAIMLGCGLRRAEVSALTFEHLKTVDGCATISNLVGKGGRVRSIAIPDLADERLRCWLDAAGLSDGYLFRAIELDGRLKAGISEETIRMIVEKRSLQAGDPIKPHDARRSCAALARRGGAPLEAISSMLGHANLNTTQKYLEKAFDPKNAAGGYIRLMAKPMTDLQRYDAARKARGEI